MWAGEGPAWRPFDIVARSPFAASGRVPHSELLSDHLLPAPHLWCLLVLGKHVHPGELHRAWHLSGQQDWLFRFCFGVFKEIKKHRALVKLPYGRWREDLESQMVGLGHPCPEEEKTAKIIPEVEVGRWQGAAPEKGSGRELQKQPKWSRALEGSSPEALSGRQSCSWETKSKAKLAEKWTESKRTLPQKLTPSSEQ